MQNCLPPHPQRKAVMVFYKGGFFTQPLLNYFLRIEGWKRTFMRWMKFEARCISREPYLFAQGWELSFDLTYVQRFTHNCIKNVYLRLSYFTPGCVKLTNKIQSRHSSKQNTTCSITKAIFHKAIYSSICLFALSVSEYFLFFSHTWQSLILHLSVINRKSSERINMAYINQPPVQNLYLTAFERILCTFVFGSRKFPLEVVSVIIIIL